MTGERFELLWAVLDLITIIVLSTGLYLWWKKGDALEQAGFAQTLGFSQQKEGCRGLSASLCPET